MRHDATLIPKHLRVSFWNRLTCLLLWPFAATGERAACFRIAILGGAFDYQKLRAFRSNVEYVYLRSLRFCDDDAPLISRLEYCETIELSGTSITDDSVDSLCRMKRLRFLILRETEITDNGLCRLNRSLPDCLITNGMGRYWYRKMQGQTALEAWAEA